MIRSHPNGLPAYVVWDINSALLNLHRNLTNLNGDFKWLTQASGTFIKMICIMKTRLILVIALIFLAGFISAQDNKASVQLAAAIYEEEVTGNLDKAVELYMDILKQYPDNRSVAAKTLYHLGLVNEKMGQQKATEYFTRVVNTYPDQAEVVALAKARLAELSSPKSAAVSPTEVTMRRIWDAGSNMPVCISPDGQYVVFENVDNYGNILFANFH